MTETPDLPAALGAIVYDGDVTIEPVLAAVRDLLCARGRLRLGGVVPAFGADLGNGRHQMFLEDLGTGTAMLISQDLGVEAEACILDSDGFTRASHAIVRAIDDGVDLVMVGKFGKQEAAGHGVRDEIARAVMAGIPTLVALRARQLEAWRTFVGDDFAVLPPEPEAIVAWAEAAAGSPA